MRIVVQRVQRASVTIDNEVQATIGRGLVVLVGFANNDNDGTINNVVEKIINLRIFNDHNNKLNLSVKDIEGDILIVPNFTLYANATSGRRPDFVNCANSDISKPLYNSTVKLLKEKYNNVYCGVFGANMQVELINDGPLTIFYEK